VRAHWLFVSALCACHEATASPTVIALPQGRPGPAVSIVLDDDARPPVPPIATPFAAGQQWVGTYQCAQGETDLVLRIVRVQGTRVAAVFEFEHADTGAAGAFELHGEVEPATREVVLAPGAWRTRPPNYVSVGLRGRVDGERFRGRVDHPSCGEFSLTLDAALDEEDSD
jgi:hypothetical protein